MPTAERVSAANAARVDKNSIYKKRDRQSSELNPPPRFALVARVLGIGKIKKYASHCIIACVLMCVMTSSIIQFGVSLFR